MLKFVTEFGLVVVFFIGYKVGGILEATLYMLVASVVSLIVTYIKERKINNMNLKNKILLQEQ